ncbi:hypothetical protein ACUQZ9_001525 [Enterobacter hormaechei]|nr:hypothetical protein [Enterobacter hormaechei subsp. xiangfangensis]
MYVFEFLKPGLTIECGDEELAWKIGNLLNHIESSFYEANVSLNLFINEMQRTGRDTDSSQLLSEFELDMKKRSELEKQVREEMGVSGYNEYVIIEAEARLRREKWNGGTPPESHSNALKYVYAKSFLSSIDSIKKFLNALANSKELTTPEKVKELYKSFCEEFPDLRGVRNTTQHLDERVRGIGQDRKPMQIQPINKEELQIPAGIAVFNMLNGSKFGTTMGDGSYGEVDVSPETLKKIQIIIQELMNCFRWVGPKSLLPR